MQKPTQALQSVKGPPMPLIETPSGQELCRPSILFHGLFIGTPPNPNIKVVFRDSSRHISGGARGSRPLRMGYWKWRHRKRPWPKWRHMKSRDRSYVITRSMFFVFPRFFSYHSSSTKCTIAKVAWLPDVTCPKVTAREVTSQELTS